MRALLHLFEQMDVADRDHRLVGEGLQQRDLLVFEGIDVSTPEHDGADGFTLAKQRNAQERPAAVDRRHAPPYRKLKPLVGEYVMHMHWPSVGHCAPRGRS